MRTIMSLNDLRTVLKFSRRVMRRNVTLLSGVFQSPNFCSGSYETALMLIILTSQPRSKRLCVEALANTSIFELWILYTFAFLSIVECGSETQTVQIALLLPSAAYRCTAHHFLLIKRNEVELNKGLECHRSEGARHQYF